MSDIENEVLHEDGFPEHILSLAKNPKHQGRMNDPSSAACVTGPCGDEIEFYLVIKDKIIEQVKFNAKGCIATVVCGSMTAQLASGKSINDALGISPKQVIDALNGLPEGHCHCSILAVCTLYRALGNYLFKL